MSMAVGGSDDEPMMDINTTPLIDVMLVLLIMFIITIPIQSHAVKLDLPQDQPNKTPPPIDPVKNKVVVTRTNQVMWNGAPVNLVQLRQYLDITTTMTPTQVQAGCSTEGRPARRRRSRTITKLNGNSTKTTR